MTGTPRYRYADYIQAHPLLREDVEFFERNPQADHLLRTAAPGEWEGDNGHWCTLVLPGAGRTTAVIGAQRDVSTYGPDYVATLIRHGHVVVAVLQ